MEREPNNQNPTNNAWGELNPENTKTSAERPLTQAELVALTKESIRKKREAAPQQAKEYISDMVDIERAFEKQLQRIAERGDDHISRKEFERWESDYANDWEKAHEEMRIGDIQTSSGQAEIEYPLMVSDGSEALSKTIEAQAGHFFSERSKELNDAIRASDDPDKEEDLQLLGGFSKSVAIHLDYKYIDVRQMDAFEAQQYDRNRTAAHNAMIKHLNALNNIARKYNVTPFTMRNFWTSENSRAGDPEPVKQRMRHDRHQVEAFCEIAFKTDAERRKRQAERYSF